MRQLFGKLRVVSDLCAGRSMIFPVLHTIFFLLSPVHVSQAHEDSLAEQPLLVDSRWLAEHLDDPGIVIVDARLPAEYEKGHIAGAINLPSTYTYQSLLRKNVILQGDAEETLGSRGINNESVVIVYGDSSYLNAARVFWVLDLYGHTKLSLLNGAFRSWLSSGLPVDTELPVVTPSKYRAVIHPGKMATRLQTLLAIENPRIAMIDTREAVEFQGAESSASRFGHIPSTINIAKGENLEVRQGVYYFKPESALETLYAGVDDHKKIILYCNTGDEAAIAYLALKLLNKNVSVYDGAWREWGNDPGLPIVSPAQ